MRPAPSQNGAKTAGEAVTARVEKHVRGAVEHVLPGTAQLAGNPHLNAIKVSGESSWLTA